MIVQCDHCNTKFNLPDEKLKPGGVKIRCTRCKEIFEVPGPEASNAGIEDSLPDDFGDDLSGFEGGDDFASEAGGGADLGGGDEDFGLGMEDSGLEGEGLDDMSFDLDSSDSEGRVSGGDLDFDESLDLDKEGGGGGAAAGDGLSFDDNSAGSDLDFDDSSDDLSLDSSDEFGISSLDGDSDTTIDEDPSGFDFSAPLGGGGDSAFEFESESKVGGGIGMGGGLDLDMGGDSLRDLGMEPTEGLSSAKMKRSRRSPLMVALLIVLIITLGAYFVFKAMGGGKLDLESLTKMFAGTKNPLDGLMIDETKLSHYYTENNQAGKILVVEGMVLNASEIPKGQIRVMLKLYDEGGKVIKSSQSYCGNILNLSELMNLPKDRITKDLNKKVNPANARVGPKTSINFILVIFDMPDTSSYFDVEIVGAENVG
ncbi:MAG: zinc-ribbon domain-containing protein [Deltaproteobacteria bacterium]|uniref:Zinc-ribbon domain-containing protein n=1 Tax=Candidatus Zymogenus saltonus TaxID=2844893 RepID=A0A9D8KGL4_9DELT|nr:zinc-ribbon domain-containing protein [Candidatus Zymogenus saltonus]